MFFAIRHGERADYVPEEKAKIEISCDPHLTPKGLLQAEATGPLINQKIDEYYQYLLSKNLTTSTENNIQVIIVASPFLRTI